MRGLLRVCLATAVVGLAAFPGRGRADTFSYAGVTFSQANSVKTARLVNPTTGETVAPTTGAYALPSLFAPTAVTPGAIYDGKNSVGYLMNPAGALAPSSTFNMGPPDVATEPGRVDYLELTFGTLGGTSLKAVNGAGDDLVVFENGATPFGLGGTGTPDVFAVAVRKAGSTEFTSYYYKAETRANFGGWAYSNTYDLSVFGLAEGDEIDAIRIRNLLPTDRIAGAGVLAGFVSDTGNPVGVDGSLFNPLLPPGTVIPVTQIPTAVNIYNPDITYVAALYPLTPAPEPGSVVLLAVGAVGLGLAVRRHRRAA